eukprot:1047898-Amphidinium_carterae.1
MKGSPLWDVFQGYCKRYSKRLQSATPDLKSSELAWQKQAAYDRWHAERDPAVAVFKGLFGQDWTERFIKEVLFPGTDHEMDTSGMAQCGIVLESKSSRPHLGSSTMACGAAHTAITCYCL